MPKAVGIDIGSEAIKGLVLNATSRGLMEVVAAGTLPLGELGHMEDSQDKTLALGEKLRQLVRSANLRATYRKVGASGKATTIRYLQVPPVPPWRLDMLVKYEVEERVADKEANTFDYQILDVPDAGGQYTVMIGMLKEAAAAELLAISRAGGLGEVEIDLEALALYNAYFHGHGFDTDKTVLVADIGADDLTVLLCHKGGLYFARTVMGAGRRFTQALADELKIEFEEAEALKLSQGEISFDVAPGTTRLGRTARPGATGTVPRPSATGIQRGAAGASQTRKPDPEAAGATGVLPAGSAPSQNQPAAPGSAAAWPTSSAAETSLPFPEGENDAGQGLPTVLLKMPDELPLAGDARAVAPASAPSTIALAAPAAQPAEGAQPSNKPQLAVPPVLDGPEEKRRRQISNALLREAAALCAALENAVQVCRQQTKMREIKIDRLYVTGGGSRLKGLAEFMGRRMRVEVMPLEPFRQLSLDRLPPEQAAALKAEQHTLAVATGLALGDLQKHALSFLLWPEAVKQRKVFWSRGAYVYYAAGVAVAAIGLFLFTPFRNAGALTQNYETALEAVNKAKAEETVIKRQQEKYDEKSAELKQILDNTQSGHYFLRLLAELKNKRRISDDIYLTLVSTKIPEVVVKAAAKEDTGLGPTPPAPTLPRQGPKAIEAADPNATPDTFQTQRVVYLRGFVRGGKDGEERIKKIKQFYGNLVPDPDHPDDPRNLFTDVRPIWFSPEEIAPRPVYKLDDAAFAAMRAAGVPEKTVTKLNHLKNKAFDTKDLFLADLARPLDKEELERFKDSLLDLAKPKNLEAESHLYLTEFVLEGYTEGTRESTSAKKPAGAPASAARKIAAPAAAKPAPVPGTAPAPAVEPAQPRAAPEAAPAAQDEADKKPKKRKLILPSDQPQPVQPVGPAAPAGAALGPAAPPVEAKKN